MKIYLILLLNFTLLSSVSVNYSADKIKPIYFTGDEKPEQDRLKQFAEKAKTYCRQNKMNENLCFIVDMNLPACKYRFFVYDLKNDLVVNKGIVAHGCCNTSFLENAEFSNTPGSGCSSLGKYKVGSNYAGRFGKAYKLYGLDSSNNNAFRRNVVMHSYYSVPDKEVYPGAVCNSLGCVMVSENFLKKLAGILDSSRKSVLLWVIN